MTRYNLCYYNIQNSRTNRAFHFHISDTMYKYQISLYSMTTEEVSTKTELILLESKGCSQSYTGHAKKNIPCDDRSLHT